LRRYVFGPGVDEPIVTIAVSGGTSTKSYNHQDGLGSIIALSTSSGAVSDKYTYGLYGETASLTGNTFRYSGRRLDAETGLYYYRARYYSPKIGRFLQNDPIGTNGGINLYAYVGNDPLNAADPSGLYASQVGDATVSLTKSAASYAYNNPLQTAGIAVAVVATVFQPENAVALPEELAAIEGTAAAGEATTAALETGAASESAAASGGSVGSPASSFSGSLRSPLEPPAGVPPRNPSGNINDVPYSGHSLDQMQNQGIPPSVTTQAIENGTQSPGNLPGTTRYYDPTNNVSVIRDATTGNVITVRPGN